MIEEHRTVSSNNPNPFITRGSQQSGAPVNIILDIDKIGRVNQQNFYEIGECPMRRAVN
jgi:hypothetical protein